MEHNRNLALSAEVASGDAPTAAVWRRCRQGGGDGCWPLSTRLLPTPPRGREYTGVWRNLPPQIEHAPAWGIFLADAGWPCHAIPTILSSDDAMRLRRPVACHSSMNRMRDGEMFIKWVAIDWVLI